MATVRKEYPHIEVTLIDSNKENFVKAFYGAQVNDLILEYKKNNLYNIVYIEKIM